MTESNVYHEVLPNGLTLLLREAHLAPVANLQIWAGVGSADERPGEEGLAHFHEHMLFKGTERRGVGDVAGDIEAAGGRVNAYTSFDTTVYYATMPSEALATGLDVLVDAIRFSRFDPDEVKRETEVVLEEIRRSEDSPAHVLGDAVFGEAYRVHPYRGPILGPAENVASFDRQRVKDFYHRWYTPDNLVVIACGEFDARELAGEIRAAFEGAEPGGTKRSRAIEPERQGLRSVVLRKAFERVRVDLSWPCVAFGNPDSTHLDLLAYLLGECESSRLIQRVKEREGVVDRIDASCYTPLDAGLFSVNFEVDSERATRAIEAAVAEVERLRHEPVTAAEMDRARANFLASEHFERESVSGMASKLGSFHVLGGDYRSEERYFEAIRNATPDDLLRVARKYLDSKQLTVGALLPESETNTLDRETIAGCVDRALERTRRMFAVPERLAKPRAAAQKSPATSQAAGRPQIESYALPGGGELHVLPRRDVPVVACRAAFLGGLLAETAETAGISNFTSSMWLRGTKGRSAADLARAIENLAADLDGFSGRSSVGFTFEVTSDKLDPTLDLFAEVLLEPSFDPEEIERERRDTLAAIERREDRLAQLAYQLFSETLFPTHPYRLPMIGNRESVERFDSDALHAHHARLIRAENLVIAVAGDVDPDAIARSLSARLASLPGGGPDAQAGMELPAEDAAPVSPREAQLTKDRAQAHMVVGFRGITVADPDRAVLEVIAQLLAGQGGRLFLDLRDRQSLAYSVSAMNVEGYATGFFSVYIATAPEKVDDARRGIFEHLERLSESRPTAEELTRVRRNLIGNHVIDGQRNASHAGHISLDALYGLGPDSSFTYPERVSSVTADDVLRVAQRMLRTDEAVVALVRP